MPKRIRLVGFFLTFAFIAVTGKLAFEQLYRSALLTGSISPDAAWIQQLNDLQDQAGEAITALQSYLVPQ